MDRVHGGDAPLTASRVQVAPSLPEVAVAVIVSGRLCTSESRSQPSREYLLRVVN
eukprot:COSAG01_NODE_16_length_40091_cov_15.728646_42_plen_55_part_00